MQKREPIKFGVVKYHERPTHVPIAELFNKEHFPNKRGRSLRREGMEPVFEAVARLSHRGRYIWHNTFLRDEGHRISTFADVGCGLPNGAPTTFEAREVLPEDTKVLAVDVTGDFNDPIFGENNIETLEHSIVEAPLPEQVDAIRFAMVSRHLNSRERLRAIVNIHKSLKPGGFLLGFRRIYIKTKKGFSEIAKKGYLEGED